MWLYLNKIADLQPYFIEITKKLDNFKDYTDYKRRRRWARSQIQITLPNVA